jgi:hypothetical protein
MVPEVVAIPIRPALMGGLQVVWFKCDLRVSDHQPLLQTRV